ncbi:unnamed protein product [Ectocarpus sp. 12 AP-2014]
MTNSKFAAILVAKSKLPAALGGQVNPFRHSSNKLINHSPFHALTHTPSASKAFPQDRKVGKGRTREQNRACPTAGISPYLRIYTHIPSQRLHALLTLLLRHCC